MNSRESLMLDATTAKQTRRQRLSNSLDIIQTRSSIELCSSSLPFWKDVDLSKIRAEKIAGGLTNTLYRVSVSEDENVQPKKVLVRYFGSGTEAFIDRDREDLILCCLAEQEGLSVPRTFERLPHARIEEWIESTVLHVSELPSQATQIAKMLANFHCTNITEMTQEASLVKDIEAWLQQIKKDNLFGETFLCLESEFAFLSEKLKETHSPVVFCHNDLQENNILYNKEREDLHFIDFEYAKYNHRGFDIGNHFCEYMIEYNSKLENGFKILIENYPTEEQQLEFFRNYLHKHQDQSTYEAEIESLIREANLFTLISHFFWGLWGLIQARQSCILFNFEQYSSERLKSYMHQKSIFFGPPSSRANNT